MLVRKINPKQGHKRCSYKMPTLNQLVWGSSPHRGTTFTGLLAEYGLAGADLSRILGGSRNLGAMILRGERNLTLPQVRKLAAHFEVGRRRL